MALQAHLCRGDFGTQPGIPFGGRRGSALIAPWLKPLACSACCAAVSLSLVCCNWCSKNMRRCCASVTAIVLVM